MAATNATETTQNDSGRVPPHLLLLGILLGAGATAASAVLALDHFGAVTAPGCGPDSGCARAAASAWGTVPLIGWPVSLLGLAYFAAVTVAWVTCARGVPAAFRWLVRIGAVAAVGFVVVMLAGGYVCKWCLAAHAANLALLVVVELAAGRPAPARLSRLPLASAALVFIAVTAGLAVKESMVVGEALAKEAELTEQTREEIIGSSTAEGATDDSSVVVVDDEDPTHWVGGFTGRWQKGPDEAPIRIVKFFDYQCRDCNRIEDEIRELRAKYDNISVAVRHFPMSTKCNPHMPAGNDMHPNACWAARAAEAAGHLHGEEGFWRMHEWLFDMNGGFTNEQFDQGLTAIGFDPQRIARTMADESITVTPIHEDVEMAIDLGLHYTPMIFVNGVQFRSIFTPNALTTLVEDLQAQSLPARTFEQDRPPLARRKLIEDWREGRRVRLPTLPRTHAVGPEPAPVEVVVWGDYSESNCGRVDEMMQEIVARRGDVRYTFRHFPFCPDCNPHASRNAHPTACRAALAAEAAATIGGEPAFWRMHAWLFENQAALTAPEGSGLDEAAQRDRADDAIRAAADAMGLDGTALLRTMNDAATAEIVTADARAARGTQLRRIPWIVVNGRTVPRWTFKDTPVLEEIIEEAAAEASGAVN